MNKLFCSDLDGTLIGKTHLVTDELKRAIEAWKADGNHFVIATGRLVSSMLYYADEIKSRSYSICCSGGTIYRGEEKIFEEKVPHEYVKKLWDYMAETGGYCQFYSGGTLVANKRAEVASRYELLKENLPEGYDIPILYASKLHRDLPQDVHKLSFTFKDELEAGEVLKALGPLEGVKGFKSLAYLYDIVSEKTDKGVAIKELMKYLDVDEVYVAGDNENDIGMFEHFENSFCVNTAPQHVQDQAKWIIESPDEEGLSKAIWKLLGQ